MTVPFDLAHLDASTVDAAAAWLDRVSQNAATQRYKQRSFQLLAVTAREVVLELGSGTGDDARTIATRTGPSGQVIALDPSPALTEVGRRRHGAGPGITFRSAPSAATGLPAGSVDAARVDRHLHGLGDEALDAVVAELHRVLRPGGRLVVCEPEASTLDVSAGPAATVWRAPPPRDLLARVVPGFELRTVERHSLRLRDYDVARDLLRLDARLAAAVAAGEVDELEALTWEFAQRNASEAGRFSASLDGLVALFVRGERGVSELAGAEIRD